MVQGTTSVSVLTEEPQSRTIQRAHDIASETPLSSLIRVNQLHDHPLAIPKGQNLETRTPHNAVKRPKEEGDDIWEDGQ